MRQRLLLALALVLVPALVDAQEAIALTTPIARPTLASYAPATLTIDVAPVPRITVVLIANVGTVSETRETFSYPCPSPCSFTTDAQVASLITTLNTVNLTTRSLWRRVFDRLLLDFPARFPGGATVQ